MSAKERAPVLVHGATGFTGALVCRALLERRIPFAIGGRNPDKLAKLAQSLGLSKGSVEIAKVDIGDGESVRAAIAGRTIVSACAGPFADVGEAVLATCARLGVHYVDTTGEQCFVADALSRYRATAEAKGASIAPAMAYEIALADWAASLAGGRLEGPADAIAITYATLGPSGRPFATTRGTKRSALAMLVRDDARQYLDGRLTFEPPFAHVHRLRLEGAREPAVALSFPSPEAVLVPLHTHARQVRTFMVTSPAIARVVRATRAFAPAVTRVARRLLDHAIAKSAAGPEDDEREARFEIVCEARRGRALAVTRVLGRDPYGLTASIQAHAIERALAGEIRAKGVVAPSTAVDPRRALRALGVTVVES